MIESAAYWLLSVLAVPTVGIPAVFFISFVSATWLPMGSEPAVFAVVKSNAALFWPAILVATAGNTLGGVVDYWLGMGAKELFAKDRESRSLGWMRRYGAKTLLLGWLPLVGDGICTLAGWLEMPFWPCVGYMAAGKFLRYVVITWLLLYVPDGVWHQIARLMG